MKLWLLLLLSLPPPYYCYQYTAVSMGNAQYHLNTECYPCFLELRYQGDKIRVITDRYNKTFVTLYHTKRPGTVIVLDESDSINVFSLRDDNWHNKRILSITPIRLHDNDGRDHIESHGLVVASEHIKGLCFND